MEVQFEVMRVFCKKRMMGVKGAPGVRDICYSMHNNRFKMEGSCVESECPIGRIKIEAVKRGPK